MRTTLSQSGKGHRADIGECNTSQTKQTPPQANIIWRRDQHTTPIHNTARKCRIQWDGYENKGLRASIRIQYDTRDDSLVQKIQANTPRKGRVHTCCWADIINWIPSDVQSGQRSHIIQLMITRLHTVEKCGKKWLPVEHNEHTVESPVCVRIHKYHVGQHDQLHTKENNRTGRYTLDMNTLKCEYIIQHHDEAL